MSAKQSSDEKVIAEIVKVKNIGTSLLPEGINLCSKVHLGLRICLWKFCQP
jgi:hypothetical protein